MRDEKPRHGKAALLSGRQIAVRQMGNAGEFHRIGSLFDSHAVPPFGVAEKGFPEVEVFRDRQFALHAVSVTEIVAEFPSGTDLVAAIHMADGAARFRTKEASDDPQQSRLSRT